MYYCLVQLEDGFEVIHTGELQDCLLVSATEHDFDNHICSYVIYETGNVMAAISQDDMKALSSIPMDSKMSVAIYKDGTTLEDVLA